MPFLKGDSSTCEKPINDQLGYSGRINANRGNVFKIGMMVFVHRIRDETYTRDPQDLLTTKTFLNKYKYIEYETYRANR